jgi:hypothetical protein
MLLPESDQGKQWRFGPLDDQDMAAGIHSSNGPQTRIESGLQLD